MTTQSILDKIAAEVGDIKAKPGGWFSKDGDCLFWYFEDVPYHAKRVHPAFALYCADDDKRVVGICVSGWWIREVGGEVEKVRPEETA